MPVNAWNIADALVAGRSLQRVQVQRMLQRSDTADALYAALFCIVREPKISRSAANAIAVPSAHGATAEAWSHILRYAGTPSRKSYANIIRAARDQTDTVGTVLRLAPMVLSSNHRRHFIKIIEQMMRNRPVQAIDLKEVCHDLRQRGPDRLYWSRKRIG